MASLAIAYALGAAPVAEVEQGMCRAIAERIPTANPSVENAWIFPIQVLAGMPDPVVYLERGSGLTQEEALETLARDSRATSRLANAITTLSEFHKTIALFHFDSSTLHAAESVQGSANCQYFAFFATTSDEQADLVESPPVIRNNPEGSLLCQSAGSWASIGEIGGEAAFIIESGKDQDEQISITPWHGNAWGEQCRVALHFSADFTIAAHSCKDVDCAKASEQARTLAMQLDKDPRAFADSFEGKTRLLRLKALADSQLAGPAGLPTLGQRSEYTSPAVGSDAILLPLTLDGETYVTRLRQAAVGWRRMPDYIFGLYRLVDDQFVAVASIHIAKRRAKPIEAIVK